MPSEFGGEQVNSSERQHVFAPLYKNPDAIGKKGRVFWFSRHGESENNLLERLVEMPHSVQMEKNMQHFWQLTLTKWNSMIYKSGTVNF